MKSQYVHLWLHILYRANHKEKEFWFNGRNIKVKRGQFVTGRRQLSVETGISESQIQRILKCFESEQQIEQQTNNHNRLITVVYYNQYQKVEQQTEQPQDSHRTAIGQPQDTNKKDKNYKNDKEEIPTREEFVNFCISKKPNIDREHSGLKYDAWVENGWKDGFDKPIKRWRAKANSLIPHLKLNTKIEVTSQRF